MESIQIHHVGEAKIGGSVGNYGNKHIETPERSFIGRNVYYNGKKTQFSSVVEDAYVVIKGTDIFLFSELPIELPETEEEDLKVDRLNGVRANNPTESELWG